MAQQRKFDYCNMPDLSRDGIKNEQGKFLTIGVFYETCQPDSATACLWTLNEKEVFDERQGKLLPSAYLTYLGCRSEYEAARKIVGSLKQWEQLKKLKWFQEHLATWSYEQAERQKLVVKELMLAQVGEGNVNAGKALLAQLEKEQKQPVGRPKKAVEPVNNNSDVDDDAERLGVVSIR